MQEDGTSGTKSEDKGDQPVTISAPPAASVTIDPQNPLPEPSFIWRRWITIVICVNALVLTWFAAAWLHHGQQWDHLYGLTKLTIYAAGLALTYYFVAPSASELTNMIQSASIIKHSLTTAAETAATGAGNAIAARVGNAVAPDSRIPVAVPGGAPRPPSGGSAGSGEIDAAPRGRP